MDLLAILLCKVLRFFSRLLGHSGGSVPGEIALKFSPKVLSRLQYPSKYILVTGTNGKTTTTSLIAHTFEKAGYRVVSNSNGDNLLVGAATTILANTGLDKRIKGDVLVLELDELTFGRRFSYFKPTDVVVTNFFRDQLDRVGEMASIISKVEAALEGFEGKIYVNADDPNLSKIGNVAFGVAQNSCSLVGCLKTEASEGKFCPECSERLEYSYYQYSHIGDYRCPKCGFARRKPNYEAVMSDDCRSFTVKGHEYPASDTGLYFVYNQMAAVAVALEHGIAPEIIAGVMNGFELGIGRMEWIGNEDSRVLLNLVKNPAGCNQVLRYISRNANETGDLRQMLFVLNDKNVDGRDVSWIWDTSIEMLECSPVRSIICSGSRAYDMALRFQYSGIDFAIEVVEDVAEAVERIKNGGGYVLSTYSSLFEVREKLL